LYAASLRCPGKYLDYGDGVDGAPTGIEVCQDALSDPSEGSRP
jgi:hypothetical protein